MDCDETRAKLAIVFILLVDSLMRVIGKADRCRKLTKRFAWERGVVTD